MQRKYFWRMRIAAKAVCTLAVIVLGLSPCHAQNGRVVSVQKQSDGIILHLSAGILRLQVWSPRVIRVVYSPAEMLPNTHSLSVTVTVRRIPWHLFTDSTRITLTTSKIQATVDRLTGTVRFFNASGAPILGEEPNGRRMTPIVLPAATPEAAYQSQQSFVLAKGEGIYGLGQHQSGPLDYRDTAVTLAQSNREVAIPFLVSSRGYGVFWDNPSQTNLQVGSPGYKDIPSSQLISGDNMPGGLTGEYFQGQDLKQSVTTRIDPTVDFNWTAAPAPGLAQTNFSVRWTGFVRAQEANDYKFVTSGDDGIRLWIDDKQVVDDWSVHGVQTDSVVLHFAANSLHSIRMEYFQGGGDAVARLQWQHETSDGALVWKSEAAEAIDYYFIYGPRLDTVIAEYRDLTGQAPMPPRWALGYWQSKNRYMTQQELIDIAQGYRSRGLPIDNLVQDWYYWDPYPWGSHKFDPSRYPDPAEAFAELHDKYHLHLMISVWAKFGPGTPGNPSPNYDALQAQGYLYPAALTQFGTEPFYDAFSPGARAMYWQQIRDELFAKGIDAWWLDASEPELDPVMYRQQMTGSGLAVRVINAYPLMHTMGVYQGQRADAPHKRVFILTRSAYAGQQRNAAATWSGDITASWNVLAAQIPAGLNFCLSGIPYWTTDIGGYNVPYAGGSDNPEYRELYTRWYEYGSFCPLFRSHGTDTPREMWRFGPDAQTILLKYDNLRYRLMPYIYSQAWQVTHAGATMMRALVMDFPNDDAARESQDEFLFGPSILVCPVIKEAAASRPVVLPKGVQWTDFWTGSRHQGGQVIDANAPIDTIPLYVRAGSIIPMGPYLQFTSEKPEDPVELRVYPGADGTFTFYEDDGTSYDYGKGRYAIIPLTWDDAAKTLTIGGRQGSFQGMLNRRTFHIVVVSAHHGTGVAPAKADKTVIYDGALQTIHCTD